MATTSSEALKVLARACGIQLAYRDMDGRVKRASKDALLATLSTLGVDIADETGAEKALRQVWEKQQSQLIEPVTVFWEGRQPELRLRLPSRRAKRVEIEIVFENGEKFHWEWKDISFFRQIGNECNLCQLRIPFDNRLPAGYHRLRVTAGSAEGSSLIIVAPQRTYSPNEYRRSWGLFSPIYSLHSTNSMGAGDLSDFGRFAAWNSSFGGVITATPPLLPAFLKEQFDPSPYSPVSRLFWNEFYIDLASVPELPACAEAAALVSSADFRHRVEELRQEPLVDYRRQMSLKRQVLELLSEHLFSISDSARQQSYSAFIDLRPEVADYARFRAVSEERGAPWPEWPDRLRNGRIEDSDCRPEFLRYYLYTQFILHEQIAALASGMEQNGQSLYLDLPLGSHRYGFDSWREKAIFASGASVGAPPDPVFPGGQNWGFPPPHPENVRQNGYRYFIETLRHHLRVAGMLRLDHIMGLHRLFWIPSGMTPEDGIYVRYQADEMYAILCLESQRHQAAIVGEDLGLVPATVRRSMRRRNIYRSYIAQYEMLGLGTHCFENAPGDSVAALNTHDMYPFAAYWQASDIPERRSAGVLRPERASVETVQRSAGKKLLTECLLNNGYVIVPEPGIKDIFQAVCRVLAEGKSDILMLNIDDLLGSVRAQNIPGTCSQHPNWRRRALRSLEEMIADMELELFLRDINLRRGAAPEKNY